MIIVRKTLLNYELFNSNDFFSYHPELLNKQKTFSLPTFKLIFFVITGLVLLFLKALHGIARVLLATLSVDAHAIPTWSSLITSSETGYCISQLTGEWILLWCKIIERVRRPSRNESALWGSINTDFVSCPCTCFQMRRLYLRHCSVCDKFNCLHGFRRHSLFCSRYYLT